MHKVRKYEVNIYYEGEDESEKVVMFLNGVGARKFRRFHELIPHERERILAELSIQELTPVVDVGPIRCLDEE